LTATSWGTKNQPQFADGDAPDVALNPSQVADYAAKVGNRRVGTTAERVAATGKDVWEGLVWGDTTLGVDFRYKSGAWLQLSPAFAMAAGAGSNANGAYATVNFPAGRFTQIPLVTATTNGAQPATMNIGSISTTSMTIAGFNASNVAVACSWHWHAVQMTPTAAAG
jgi:hypothetical protein